MLAVDRKIELRMSIADMIILRSMIGGSLGLWCPTPNS